MRCLYGIGASSSDAKPNPSSWSLIGASLRSSIDRERSRPLQANRPKPPGRWANHRSWIAQYRSTQSRVQLFRPFVRNTRSEKQTSRGMPAPETKASVSWPCTQSTEILRCRVQPAVRDFPSTNMHPYLGAIGTYFGEPVSAETIRPDKITGFVCPVEQDSRIQGGIFPELPFGASKDLA